jgi:hypothetical protein
MGTKERLEAVIRQLSDEELAQVVTMAETMARKHQENQGRVQEALALFARHRGAYRGGFDREEAHER